MKLLTVVQYIGVSFQLPWFHHFEVLQETKKQTVRLEAINKFEGFRFHGFTYVVVANTCDASGWKLWNHSRTFKSHPGGQHWQWFLFCGKKTSIYLWCVFRITCIKNHEKPKISKDCPFEAFEGLRIQFPPMAKLSARLAYSSEYILGHSVPRQPRVLFWPCWYFDILCMQSQSFGEHIHSWFAGPFKCFSSALLWIYRAVNIEVDKLHLQPFATLQRIAVPARVWMMPFSGDILIYSCWRKSMFSLYHKVSWLPYSLKKDLFNSPFFCRLSWDMDQGVQAVRFLPVDSSELQSWCGLEVGQAPALPIWYATTSELYNTYFLRMIYLHSTQNLDVATVNMDWRWIFWRCIWNYIHPFFGWLDRSKLVQKPLFLTNATVLQFFPTISDHLRRFQERRAWQNAIDLLYGFQHTVQEITRDQEVRNCCQTIGACERGRLGGLVVDVYRLQWAWAIKKSLDALNRVVHSVSTYVVDWFGCGHCGVWEAWHGPNPCRHNSLRWQPRAKPG